MRLAWIVSAVLLAVAAASAIATPVERAIVVRPGYLLAQPFIDAAKIAPVAADQQVVIIARNGGWVQVRTNGQTGWLRALDLRATTAFDTKSPRLTAQLLRTGSVKITPVIGIKGHPVFKP